MILSIVGPKLPRPPVMEPAGVGGMAFRICAGVLVRMHARTSVAFDDAEPQPTVEVTLNQAEAAVVG